MSSLETNVAGVTFDGRQAILALYRGRERLSAELRREPSNPFDPNAIRVNIDVANPHTLHVGYIPKSLAARLAPRMDGGTVLLVTRATVLYNEGTYGLRICIDTNKEEAN